MKKVCLDPGHYKGYNRGYDKNYAEGTAMFDYALRLKAKLEAAGVSVVMTKTKVEENPSLSARGKMAAGCDLFVSLHSNGVDDPKAYGVSTFYSIKRNGDKTPAQHWCDELAALIGTRSRGATTRQGGGDWDYYTVIQSSVAAGVPHSFIIEHSFHSNPTECAWLMKDANLEKMATLECKLICEIIGVQQKTEPVITKPGTMRVNTPGDTLNVRTEGKASATKIGELPDGAVVTVLGTAPNGWAQIQYTVTGWVNGSYLKEAGKWPM